jgi:hypothetical protein
MMTPARQGAGDTRPLPEAGLDEGRKAGFKGQHAERNKQNIKA